jgi:alkyl sulfatase BDS1-like metallo-beta-lactamase superfamily hydrolase
MLVLVLVIAACSSTNNDIESAQFNLDHGEYEAAIAILDDVVANDSTNYKATSLLASAFFGRGFLGESGSYLGVFANFLEGQE